MSGKDRGQKSEVRGQEKVTAENAENAEENLCML